MSSPWHGTLPVAASACEGPVSPSHPASAAPVATTEEELVKRAQGLEEAALCSLFDLYYPKVYIYGIIQLREPQAAEDLASDVMLKVIESIRNYHPRGVPLSAWIFRIARNRIVDIRRRGS